MNYLSIIWNQKVFKILNSILKFYFLSSDWNSFAFNLNRFKYFFDFNIKSFFRNHTTIFFKTNNVFFIFQTSCTPTHLSIYMKKWRHQDDCVQPSTTVLSAVFLRSTTIIYLLLYNTNFLKPKVNCYNGVLRHPLYNWWCKLSKLSNLSKDFDFVDYNIMLKQLKS